MNPATAVSMVCVDELIRGGLRDVVVCPGSRSAPLALACADAADEGRIELHVRVDERTAAFLALGLAKVSGAPAAVVTTSGTAVANLLPAVVEASYSGIPLIVLTADRPPELLGVGANQTIKQVGIFGEYVRTCVPIAPVELDEARNADLRSTVSRAVARAKGALDRFAGPVHFNVALRDPLVPNAGSESTLSMRGRPRGLPWTVIEPAVTAPEMARLSERTLVIVGDCVPTVGYATVRLAEERGWPVISEPSGNAAHGPNAITTGHWLLGDDRSWTALRPDDVLIVGRPTLSRAVQSALRDSRVNVTVVATGATWSDAPHVAARVLPELPVADGRHKQDLAWLEQWRGTESAGRRRIDAELDATRVGEQHAVRALHRALGSDTLLIAGSSLPIRHLFMCAQPRDGVTVVANRGAAGIDGTVSTAIGAAHAWQRDGGGAAYALMGDLTFLHDSGGLAINGGAAPRLTIVVLNNDGGGIFELLEPAESVKRERFEQVFGTPHGIDLAALCGAHGVPFTRAVETESLLEVALDTRADLQVVELRTDRAATADTHRRLATAVFADGA